MVIFIELFFYLYIFISLHPCLKYQINYLQDVCNSKHSRTAI